MFSFLNYKLNTNDHSVFLAFISLKESAPCSNNYFTNKREIIRNLTIKNNLN